MKDGVQAPLPSLAAASGLALTREKLTREKLIGTRWHMGVSGRGELTSSFYFGADGRIKVFKSFNEASWDLAGGSLEIFDDRGTLAWHFDLLFQLGDNESGQLVLFSGYRKPTRDVGVSLYLLEHRQAQVEAAAPVVAPAVAEEGAPADPSAGPEAVRLVIWDLDDTFWQGTLSEGAVIHNARNAAIVEALNQRGIVNAICSKNNHAPVEAALREQGLWDKFVFPKIAFAPKGAMVAEIIKDAQLRAPTVMFIDDNVTNLNEALFYSPGLQIAEPDFLEALLDDPRFKGKPDPELNRLARYRVLERKLADQAKSTGGGTDNVQFLRESKIRISIHANIEDEFARIHDLVNRTNQLNFTKNRWPDDPAAALRQFRQEQGANFYGHAGYVKVSDQYGDYGICGFFLVTGDVCRHFLFSCRSMNMGVEQFVWARIGRPYVPVQGEVISDIDMPVDWISVVEDADVDAAATATARKTMTVCIRGACDMTMTSNFLRTRVETIEELTFAYQGWEICALPRIAALADEMRRPRNQEIVARLPGIPAGRFETDLVAGVADAYVLSFSQESFQGIYQSRSTGMIIPMGHFGLGQYQAVKPDYTKIPYDALLERGIKNISAEQWGFFQAEFIFRGGFNEALFMMDVIDIFTSLKDRGKQAVIVGLNSQVGRDKPILAFFAKINAIVRPLVIEFGFGYVDVNEFIRSEDDLASDGNFGGPHFAREVYLKIADAILARLRSTELVIADAA